MTVLVIGEALVDVVNRPGGDPVSHAGGSPFNVAVGLSRLDIRTLLAAQIAPDAYGALLLQRLDESGVLLSNLEPVPSRTSSASATLAADGSASYVFDLTWDPAQLPDPADFEAVHVGSLGTSLEPGASLVAGLVVSADALGIPVSYDPNVRLAVEPDATVWSRVFESIAPYASIIKMSDEDSAVLFPDEAPLDLARRLSAERGLVAITSGGEGAVVGAAGGAAFVKAPAIDVVDTIGAGDSFMAAMLAWCAAYFWPSADELDLTELTDLAAYAAMAAAITCSRPGADPPRSADLH